MNVSVYLLLGSNLNERLENLSRARQEISRLTGSTITTSSIYKTAAWGMAGQPDFLNQVIEIKTGLSPDELLTGLLEIERDMGRVRNEKWGPRIIDIDILFYGNLILSSSVLTIPHPEIPNRKFTLLPLAELAPDLIHPALQKTIGQLLRETKDTLAIEKVSL